MKGTSKTAHRYIQRLWCSKKVCFLCASFTIVFIIHYFLRYGLNNMDPLAKECLQMYSVTNVPRNTNGTKNNMVSLAKECLQMYCVTNLPRNTHGTKENFIPSSLKEIPEGAGTIVPKTFLLEEQNYCKNRPNLKVIAYVHSAISATNKRQETRDTWADVSSALGVVFMVGRAKSKEEEAIVRDESKLYKDIVQGDYIDAYELLTYKALNSLYWVTNNCENVPWVLHSDDDTVIDVFTLISTINSLGKDGKQDEKIFCHIFRNAKSRREDKWAVTLSQYPCEFYPPYCAGPCWFTSMKSAKTLLNVAPTVRFLWVDDVFLTGFVAAKGGIKLCDAHIQVFHMDLSEIGSRVAWTNHQANRSEAWLKIREYHAKDKIRK